MSKIHTLDIVSPFNDSTSIGIVQETSLTNNSHKLSVYWITNNNQHKNAWWPQENLIKISNLAKILTDVMAHPFSDGYENIY